MNPQETKPKLHDIKKGIKLFKENKCDFVIAVGGGSVIDIAKSINILAVKSEPAEKYIKGELKITNKGKTSVAIPTTSGSGSEATHFAVVYIDKTKFSLAHEDYMLPNYSIVDPQLTITLPKKITASTGMDALCQGIESFWCVNSTDKSKAYAREAIKLAINNLKEAVNNPSKESREAMAKAAHLAGKAINISKTTAAHAVSYPITSYFNIPHGHAVALTLPYFIPFNIQVTEKDILDKRGVNYVKETTKELLTILNTETKEEAQNKILNLMQEINLNTKIKLGKEDIEIIIKNGFDPQRVKNNPRLLTEENLRGILKNIVI